MHNKLILLAAFAVLLLCLHHGATALVVKIIMILTSFLERWPGCCSGRLELSVQMGDPYAQHIESEEMVPEHMVNHQHQLHIQWKSNVWTGQHIDTAGGVQ